MAIFVDRTSGKTKRYKTGICHYCDHSKYPNGKIIDPSTDKNARRTNKGDFMCGVCALEINQRIVESMNRRKGIFTQHD
jgi:hypothetical protein